jgi:HK97 gp10 family phage protein
MGLGSNPIGTPRTPRGSAGMSIQVIGDKELIKVFSGLASATQRKIARPAASAAMTPTMKRTRANARAISTEDGNTIAKSLGKRTVVYKSSGVVAVVIGPRDGKSVGKHNPVKTAHLVEFGTKPHIITARNANLLSNFNNDKVENPEVFGRSVTVSAPGTPFMRPGWDDTKSIRERTLRAKIASGLDKEAKRLAAKAGK